MSGFSCFHITHDSTLKSCVTKSIRKWSFQHLMNFLEFQCVLPLTDLNSSLYTNLYILWKWRKSTFLNFSLYLTLAIVTSNQHLDPYIHTALLLWRLRTDLVKAKISRLWDLLSLGFWDISLFCFFLRPRLLIGQSPSSYSMLSKFCSSLPFSLLLSFFSAIFYMIFFCSKLIGESISIASDSCLSIECLWNMLNCHMKHFIILFSLLFFK